MKTTSTRPKRSPNQRPREPKRPVFRFSLIYSGPTELTDEIENALLEAGCDDALLGIQGGRLFLDFAREAPSFRLALTSAIMDVEFACLGLELVRVDSDGTA